MKEENRLKTVEKIKRKQSERENERRYLDDLRERIKLMELNPIVLTYLKLSREIYELEKRCSYQGSVENLIDTEFFSENNNYVCKHDLLIYAGSYSETINYENELDYSPCFDETGIDRVALEIIGRPVKRHFSFNRYLCLDCHKELDVKDYEKFESEHVVLKDYLLASKAKEYAKLYYKLLYEVNTEDAQEELSRIYNRDSKNIRVKKRK